jgi:hypothetical protein
VAGPSISNFVDEKLSKAAPRHGCATSKLFSVFEIYVQNLKSEKSHVSILNLLNSIFG